MHNQSSSGRLGLWCHVGLHQLRCSIALWCNVRCKVPCALQSAMCIAKCNVHCKVQCALQSAMCIAKYIVMQCACAWQSALSRNVHMHCKVHRDAMCIAKSHVHCKEPCALQRAMCIAKCIVTQCACALQSTSWCNVHVHGKVHCDAMCSITLWCTKVAA